MAMAYVVEPELCPVRPMRIEVSAQGYTRVSGGRANVSACLASDPARFFRFLMPRLLGAVEKQSH
jgi:hypothetical protein